MGTVGFGLTQMLIKRREGRESVQDVISQPIGNITSRDQIINPDDLVNPAFYANTRAGRAQYESDRQAAIYYAQQQEAAYKDWYNSTEQQVIRDRDAGLNPDLNGLTDSAPASETNPVETSPMQGLPTNGEMILNSLHTLGSIGSVFQSVSSIMSTISQIGLNAANKDLINSQIGLNAANKDLIKAEAGAQSLANVSNFMKYANNTLADRLAKSISEGGESFNIEDFYSSDFSDIINSAPDDPIYREAFDKTLRYSQQVHSDAYKSLSATEEGRKKYASSLASKFYHSDDNEMVGQLRIIVQAQEDLNQAILDTQHLVQVAIGDYANRIDAEGAALADNSQFEFNQEYFDSLEGQIQAAFQQGMLRAQFIQQRAFSDVYGYLNREFNNPIYDSDTLSKQRIGWQIVAGTHFGWQDHLAATADKRFNLLLDQARAQIENLRTIGATAIINAKSGESNAAANWHRTMTERYRYQSDMVTDWLPNIGIGFGK